MSRIDEVIRDVSPDEVVPSLWPEEEPWSSAAE